MRTLFLIVAALATSNMLLAQSVLATGGSSYTSPSVSVNWTVGETVIQTFDASSALVTQGMHQDNALPTIITEQSPNLLTIWPNPAREVVTISGSKQPIERIEIFDAVGKWVVTHTQKNTFSVAPLAAGSYVVRVHSNARSEEHRLVVVD
jgi:hypothetical protein